ncbi:MAG: hypothetical protein AB7P02_08370 [Alphaproteobacteria bacterium]
MAIKLFTPLSVGAFDLAHRIFVLGRTISPSGGGGPRPMALARRTSRGGLVVVRPATGEAAQRDHGKPMADAIRGAGGIAVAEIADAAAAREARDAGFDGVELDGTQACIEGAAMLGEAVRAVAEIWERERLFVRLMPFAPAPGLDDEARSRLFVAAAHQLDGEEIAAAHVVADRSEVERGFGADAHVSGLARMMRGVFRGTLLASGDYTLADAIRLVEGRWADAATIAP